MSTWPEDLSQPVRKVSRRREASTATLLLRARLGLLFARCPAGHRFTDEWIAGMDEGGDRTQSSFQYDHSATTRTEGHL